MASLDLNENVTCRSTQNFSWSLTRTTTCFYLKIGGHQEKGSRWLSFLSESEQSLFSSSSWTGSNGDLLCNKICRAIVKSKREDRRDNRNRRSTTLLGRHPAYLGHHVVTPSLYLFSAMKWFGGWAWAKSFHIENATIGPWQDLAPR